MRRVVEENNVYRWAANLLTALAGTHPAPAARTPEAAGNATGLAAGTVAGTGPHG